MPRLPLTNRWRRLLPCINCPFGSTPESKRMRNGLRRYRSILASLRRGATFWCHKHTHHDDENDEDDGIYIATSKDRLCAGAIAYQEKHHCVSQFQQVAERLDILRAQRKERTPSPPTRNSRSSATGSTPTS
jgi:hypothetical protein